jgi:hypothetical protein
MLRNSGIFTSQLIVLRYISGNTQDKYKINNDSNMMFMR